MELAIKTSNNSAPGPDGIPYAAWRNAGRQAAIILLEAITQLQEDESDNSSVPDNFNASYLCCLPKKPSGTDPNLGEYYLPSATRPLSLVSTDNRLIASALRIAIEGHIEKVISHCQRGFLGGRKMLENVLDIDFESMRISLAGSGGR